MGSWQRKEAGIVVALVGVAFLGSVIVNDLFSVGPAFERMSGGFRPAMEPEAVAALKHDLAGMQAVSEEFGTTAVPMLSQALQTTPEDFTGLMGTQFPDVATGMQQLPTIVTSFEGVVGTLEAEQDRFADADAIPTSSLPATTIPWGLTIAGVVLVVIGVLMVLRPGRGLAIAAVVVGALMIAAPLVLSLPKKASSADTMNEHLTPVYTPEMVVGARQALGVVGAMGTQMQSEMLPALGQQLGMDETALQTFLQENLPAMSGAIAGMPDAMGRFTTTIDAFETHLDDFDILKPVAFVPIVWTMIVGGAIALFAGAWGLVGAKAASKA